MKIKQNPKYAKYILCVLCLSFTQVSFAEMFTTASNQNCKIHNQFPIPNETVTYEGECSNSYAEGKSSVAWAVNGKIHQIINGQYKQGKLEGECSIVVSDSKMRFDGQCKNDMPVFGTYIDKEGKIYTGNLVNGKPPQ
jgi:hypothetical protein